MLDLGTDDVALGARAADKSAAIRVAGEGLVRTGHIEAGYIDSMLGREEVANTFLGNGVAIPHGLPKDRGLIRQTGIFVAQFPGGVEWNPGETVHLAVAIAARSDEHIEILKNLTHLLDDAELIGRLAVTEDAGEIVRALRREPVEQPQGSPTDQLAGFEKGVEAQLQGGVGLHARPATFFVNVAKKFESEVRVAYVDHVANGKSLASLLKLGAEGGANLLIMARGADEDAALAALKAAVAEGLGEDEAEAAAEHEAPVRTAGAGLELAASGIPGIAASPGVAIGPLARLHAARIVVAATAKDPEHEAERLRQAIEHVRIEVRELYEDVKARSGEGKAGIFKAHEEFLDDPDLLEQADALIRQGHSAGWAWREAVKEQAAALAQMNDPLLRERAADLGDVGQQVLRLLAESIEEAPELPDGPVILVAEDLTPSDTARLNPSQVLGLCTAVGGPTSHTAIIARSLGIPAVVGAGPAVLRQPEGATCVLDGEGGSLYVDPSPEDLEKARLAREDLGSRREEERLNRYQPAFMLDGHRIEVVANIGAAGEAAQAVEAGGEGVGLLRSEFLFLGREQAPSEDEQYQAYSDMVAALNGLPLIVRTLDIGGDKLDVPYLELPAEANPFLGVRGIRLCLEHPELFRTQLRAIYRAAAHGPVKIMFPMISTLDELRAARAIAEEERAALGAPELEIGIMIEVPSTVVMAEEFAREVDFFSVGTNDLTQYTLAMDRQHPALARQVDGLHPAVLRLIRQAVQAADAAGIWVGVCGGVAGDPKGAVVLAGLGVSELSMAVPSIAAIKERLRGYSLEEARSLAERALSCSSSAEVRALEGF
ncbi:phosphoenolpyruvate--protein phosphotransferase [Acidihalobacter prosperus]